MVLCMCAYYTHYMYSTCEAIVNGCSLHVHVYNFMMVPIHVHVYIVHVYLLTVESVLSGQFEN